jgi:dihydrofolate reductase
MDIIFATTQSGLFGKNNQLPWRCKDDLQHFNRITTNTFATNTVIMGRNTWESLPTKLLGYELLEQMR